MLVPRSAWEPGFCEGPTPFTCQHLDTPWSLAGGLCCPPIHPQLVLFLEGQVGSVPDTGHACRGQTATLTLMASPKPETLRAVHSRLPGPCGRMLETGSEPWLLLGEAGSSTCLDCFGKNEDRQVLVDPVHPGSHKAFHKMPHKVYFRNRALLRARLAVIFTL